jgi:hypothetical protein
MTPSENNLLGSGKPYTVADVERPKPTRVPIWLYHQKEAPLGIIVRDEAVRDRLEEEGWVKTPALFSKVPEVVIPPIEDIVIPKPTNVPDNTPMEEVIDSQENEGEDPGAEDVTDVVEEEEIVANPVYACPTCGKEFGLPRTLKQHITAAHSKKKR